MRTVDDAPDRLRATVALVVCAVLANRACSAQPANGPLAPPGSAFVNLTSVRSTRLSNAVRVELRFDGTFQLFVDPEANGWIESSDGQPTPHPTPVIQFRILNARSQAGSFFDVSSYPISHVEVAIPVGAIEGIGLDVTIPLYTAAWFKGMRTQSDILEGWPVEHLPRFFIQESQDRRSLIITVESDRQTAEELRGKSDADAAKQRHELDISVSGGVLSVRALNVSVAEFAEALSAATGTRIAVDDEVRRTVTMVLPATDLNEVLDSLCRGYGLACARVGEAYVLVQAIPREGSHSAAPETAVIPLRYLNAKTAVDCLPDFLRRVVRESPDHNAVVITGPGYLVEKVTADLRKLDRPTPQVRVYVTAVELANSELIHRVFQASGQARSLRFSADSESGDLWYATGPGDYEEYVGQVRALQDSGQARILSSTQALVLNGEEANLFLGSRKLIQVRVSTWHRQEETLIDVDIGTRLRVTPRTIGNGEITLTLGPEVGTLATRDPATGMPTLEIRRYRGTVRVASGDTVIIGGLNQHVALRSRRRIPVLGQLPLVGWLFTSSRRSVDRSEVVVLVSVRSVGSSGEITRSPS